MAAARKTRALQAEVREALNRGAVAQMYRNGKGVFLPANGRRLNLIKGDGVASEAGRIYYEELGVPVPTLYSYEEPLIDDQWVRGFDGKKHRVRKWNKTTSRWEPTAIGRNYFKHNKTEWVVTLPAKRVFNHKGKRDYWRLDRVPLTEEQFGGRITTPALNAAGHFNDDRTLYDLIRRAVIAWIASRPVDPEFDNLPIIVEQSDSVYLFFEDPDQDHKIEVIVRATNVFDSDEATTEAIMHRPLRGTVDPGAGVYASWDLHQHALDDSNGRCVPVMLHDLCLGRHKRNLPGGRQEKYYKPMFDLEYIDKKLDEIFKELYTEKGPDGEVIVKCPYDGVEGGWREHGCTAEMALRFGSSHDITTHVVHKSRVIKFYKAKEVRSHQPIISFSVWNAHAFFYDPIAGPHSARHTISTNMMRNRACLDDDAREEEEDKKKRLPFDDVTLRDYDDESDKTLYSNMIDLPSTAEELYEKLKEESSSRKRSHKKDNKASRKHDTVYRTSCCLEVLERDLKRVFGVRTYINMNYGATLERPVSLTLRTKLGETQRNYLIKQVPEEADLLCLFCENFGVPYYGDGLASSVDRVFNRLLQRKATDVRSEVTAAVTNDIIDEQSNKCAHCQVDFFEAGAEIDHIVPVANGGTSDRSNLQALCRPCHRQKTFDEDSRDMRFSESLKSTFSPDLLEGFVDEPKPKQLVWGTGHENCCAMDVNGCRRNGLLNNQEELPIFVLLDRILRFKGKVEDFDFVWVDKGRASDPPGGDDKTQQPENGVSIDAPFLRDLPYTGPRWYWKTAVRYMLDEKIVQYDHLLYGLRASRHAKPEVITALFQKIADGWARLQTAFPGSTSDSEKAVQRMQKQSLLALIGLWSQQHHYSYRYSKSPFDSDAPIKAVYAKVLGEHDVPKETLCRQSHPTNRAMYPFALIALNMEHVYVAMGLRELRKIGVKHVTGMVNDSIYFRSSSALISLVSKRIVKVVTHERTGEPIFRLQTEMTAPLNVQSVTPLNRPHGSPWVPDNFMDEDEPARELMPMPFGHWSLERRFCYERLWRIEREPDEPEDDDVMGRKHIDRFVKLAVQNEGALWHGLGGTGKSWAVSLLESALEDEGWFVKTVALTHVAAAIAGGGTLAHEINASGKRKNFALIIDECSVIGMHMWAKIAQWQFVGVRFFIVGDFGQLPPIGSDGDELAQFEQSDFLHSLVRGLRCDFRLYRRGTDRQHFNFVRSLYNESRQLMESVAAARTRYPPQELRKDAAKSYINLVMSHVKRVSINMQDNLLQLPSHSHDAVLIKRAKDNELKDSMSNLPQDMWVWPGMRLQGRVKKSEKHRIINGEEYEVVAVDEGHLTVKRAERPVTMMRKRAAISLLNDEESEKPADAICVDGELWAWPGAKLRGSNEERKRRSIVTEAEYEVLSIDDETLTVLRRDTPCVKLDHTEASLSLRLQYAITYFSSQGRTLRDVQVRLDDTSHPHFSLRHLRVGLGRAPEGKDVVVL